MTNGFDFRREIKKWMIAYFILFLAILGLCSIFSSCGTAKVVKETETIVEYRDRMIHDTTTFEITKEVEKIITRDTISRIENTYARSKAIVSNGFLTHTLESKPQFIKVPVEVHVTDTLKIEKQAEIREVKVEKELNWWQKLRLWAFLPLLLLALIAYRNEVAQIGSFAWKLIQKLIKII